MNLADFELPMRGTTLILHFLVVVLLACPLTLLFLVLLHGSDLAPSSSPTPTRFQLDGEMAFVLIISVSGGAFVSIPAAALLAVVFYSLRRIALHLPAPSEFALLVAFPLAGVLVGLLAGATLQTGGGGSAHAVYLPAALAGSIVGLIEYPVWRHCFRSS